MADSAARVLVLGFSGWGTLVTVIEASPKFPLTLIS
jgi:hypothetical protein